MTAAAYEPLEPTPKQVRDAFEAIGGNIIKTRGDLEDAVNRLIEAFRDGRHSEINLAAHSVQTFARQIAGLSSSLMRGCVDQMNRRPR